ncbi:MAG: response regulator [Acidimicrobiia bacterium]
MIRVVIADDHRLLLEGLADALGRLPDIEVVGLAEDGTTLVEMVATAHPDVVLLDLEMPRLGGLAALRSMDRPPTAVVVTMHADEEHRERARRAGVVGFLSKSTPLPRLAAAVRAAAAGEFFLDVEGVLDRYRVPATDPGLTDRERELLAWLAAGVSTTDELSNVLFISHKTVKNHLANIYEKMGVSDRAAAAVEALKLGITPARRE